MLTDQMLQQLAEQHDQPCVTIYSPTHDSGAEAEGDPIWLKTGIQEAEATLKEWDVAPEQIERILEPARGFQADLGPNDYGAGALAAFLADGFSEILHTPVQVDQQVRVSDRFHAKPLLPVLAENAEFYVLGISQKDVRLLQCTRFVQAEEPLSRQQVPQHIAEVVPDIQPRESLQQRTARPRIQEPGGGHEAAFHGHGRETTVSYQELFQYFREVSKGIIKYMDGRSPLIFAGVGDLFPIYRDANTYEHLLDQPIRGNPEHLWPEELRERAWKLLAPHLRGRIAQVREAFEEALAYNRATNDMKGVALTAHDGRVATFIGAVDRQYWGRVPEMGEDVQMRAEPEPWDYDLIDYATVQTILNGGTAYTVPDEQVPGGGHGAAVILRY
ncbi:MAG: hypothetical protein U9R79_20105 [Armatimonadota bacterium]|nr:hypothetical protein [Armatimonadota bacterium]